LNSRRRVNSTVRLPDNKNRKQDTMSKLKWSVVLVLLLIAAQPNLADNRTQVQGVWKLVSYEVEIQATGQKEPLMGRSPSGYAIFTAEGRAMFIVTGEGRKPAKTIEERADLLSSLVAYTGTYRIEGDKWITKVEVAWNPDWVGTEQTRFFKVEGDRLQVLTPWRVMPNWPEKGMTRSILMLERAK
jgi:Lipocalin-like domain